MDCSIIFPVRKRRLFTPGPTPLIPQAQLALARPIIHHRKQEFKELLLQTRRNLQKILKTENEVVILTASGTGAMEAAVTNLLSAEDEALAVVAGKFGERWLEICLAHGITAKAIEKEMGQAACASEICQVLEGHPQIRALLIQGCETSTGTSHDLEEIGLSVSQKFPDVLIVVDAVTALLSQPIETDQWHLDVVLSGSQKGVGMPPGLSFMSLSARALEKIEKGPPRAYYFGLREEVNRQREGQNTFTPAVSLINALNETTREILRQDPDRVVADTDLMARCTRQGLLKLGFKLLSHSPSGAVTAAFPPQGILASQMIETLEEEFGIQIAGGQGSLKGRIIRIAHLGYFDLVDVFSVLSAIELCLTKMEMKIELGLGTGAAMREALRKTDQQRQKDLAPPKT